jgi:hypothetical protein
MKIITPSENEALAFFPPCAKIKGNMPVSGTRRARVRQERAVRSAPVQGRASAVEDKPKNLKRSARMIPSRRAVLAGAAAATAISGFPFVSLGYAAQTLKFWQFYAPGGLGASTIPAGGERARSNSSSTATRNFRPSAAPAPRIISAAPIISTRGLSIRPSRAPIANSPRPMPACRRSSGRTASIVRSSASASIAGTSWTRSASRRTSA